ncbi:HD domain-containing protein [Mucilaginibacter pedocola]|uniref:HD domain-containing protein n=1 Tax=Mucilaginibacter pedocola TaxID=1792845 RepID=A0A1S9PAZ2_9SPHI|nr:hypothetical protein [Mucilaginibacter pedocola]OOQ57987.1 hypothetical protein BC343_09985 [Mucilaginibacter pedocola]
MSKAALLRDAETYVTQLLSSQLSADMHFHNMVHTRRVVAATKDIVAHSPISKSDARIVEIAAWFHDTGYCYAYAGHEDSSIAIAATFLTQQGMDEGFINKVTGCIRATQMPQNPQNLLEQILCDADLYHLSVPEYTERSALLRREWAIRLKKAYTDREWTQSNISLLTHHTYFTNYGKTVLQKRKLDNIDALLANFPK